MKIGVINNSHYYSKYAIKLRKELENLGANVDLLFSDQITLENSSIWNSFDLIYSRLSGLKWTFEMYHQLALQGIPILPNSFYFLHSQNKYLMSVLAHCTGISVPKTALISVHPSFQEENLALANQIGYPLVIKPLYSSSQGTDAFLIHDSQEFKNGIEEFQKDSSPREDLIGTYDYLLLQEMVEYDKIIRSFVIEGETLDAVFVRPLNGWKTSACGSSEVQKQEISSDLKEFNKNIFKSFRGEIMIVDLFKTEHGFALNECNTACSLLNMESATGVNHARIIAKYLIRKATSQV